jgi:hypothetical protein
MYKFLHTIIELWVDLMRTTNRNNAFIAGFSETARAPDSQNWLQQMRQKQEVQQPRHKGLQLMSKLGLPRRKNQIRKLIDLHDFKIEEHNVVIQMAVPKVARVTVPAVEVLHVMTGSAVKHQAPTLERRATGPHLRLFDLCRDQGWVPREQLTGWQEIGLTSEYTYCKRVKRHKCWQEKAL